MYSSVLGEVREEREKQNYVGKKKLKCEKNCHWKNNV